MAVQAPKLDIQFSDGQPLSASHLDFFKTPGDFFALTGFRDITDAINNPEFMRENIKLFFPFLFPEETQSENL